MADLLFDKDPSIPVKCSECGEKDLEYLGLGGYRCKKCGHVMFDDYGKVREYLDAHSGATVSEVSRQTGIPTGKIRQMVKDEKFEIAANSAIFLYCEMCGKPIRLGRFCEACTSRQNSFAATQKSSHSSDIQGFGVSRAEGSGAKRFNRE